MDISELFEKIHGEVDFSKVYRLVDYPRYQPKGFDEIVELLGADKDGFYYDPNAFITNYFYAKDGFYHSFEFFNLEMFKEIPKEKEFVFFDEVSKFKKRKEYIKKLLSQKNYEGVIFSTDKKFRFSLYKDLFDKIPDDEKFDIFIDIYSSSEYGFNLIEPNFIRNVFNYRFKSKTRKPFKEIFPKSNKYITIYRGVTEKSSPLDKAYSWTLDEDIAWFFATRFKSNGKVIKAKVDVENIITYIDSRNEKEVIVLPEHVILEG